MSTRERMTWGAKSAAGVVLPVEVAAKKASAHPQTPDEGITHPAGYPDPKQPAAYENGDTSSWAEDPHPGPYRTSPAPANPMDDGGYRHPAAQPGAPAKNASTLRAAAERKAQKCIRLASALLGEDVTRAAEAHDKAAVDLIEDQALDFMNLSDDHIASTLRRLEAATMDEEVLLRKMLASEEGEEEEETEEEPKKEASASKRAEEAKFAEITSMLAGLQAQLSAMQNGGPSKAAEAPMDEEAMLAEMMAEEAPAVAGMDEEAMLAEMLAEEAPAVAEMEAPAVAGNSLANYLEEDLMMDEGISMDGLEDPMGLYDDSMLMENGDDEILASLFASDKQAKKAEDEESEPEEEEVKEDKTAAARTAAARARTAALNPQPRKPSSGAQSVGAQVRVAGSDLNELSRLWESAPDVTKVFNS